IGIAFTGSVLADENVRAVQEKLRGGGFYQGEIDGAYSSQLSAALTRYQIRNGLPITGQLDEDTSKALGAKPGVTDNSVAAAGENSSETWRQLRSGERRSSKRARQSETAATEARKTLSPHAEEMTEVAPRSASAATAEGTRTERLRDYVGAFVLARLDQKVGSEAEFFADRVHYYDQRVLVSHRRLTAF